MRCQQTEQGQLWAWWNSCLLPSISCIAAAATAQAREPHHRGWCHQHIALSLQSHTQRAQPGFAASNGNVCWLQGSYESRSKNFGTNLFALNVVGNAQFVCSCSAYSQPALTGLILCITARWCNDECIRYKPVHHGYRNSLFSMTSSSLGKAPEETALLGLRGHILA